MNGLRKAAEMALEALETHVPYTYKDRDYEPIQALRQALAQPEWVCCVCGEPEALGVVHSADSPCFHYTKREWVGLTAPEVNECYDLNPARFASNIEAKLKDKNT